MRRFSRNAQPLSRLPAGWVTGAGIARLTRAIRDDERAVLTVSVLTPQVGGIQNVTLSIPRVVGADGVRATLPPALSDKEDSALHRSAKILKEATGSIGY